MVVVILRVVVLTMVTVLEGDNVVKEVRVTVMVNDFVALGGET